MRNKFLPIFKKMFFIKSTIFGKGTDFEYTWFTDKNVNKGKKKFLKIFKNAILNFKKKKKQFKPI